MSKKSLIVCWREPISNEWVCVGKLSYEDDLYRFYYTKGLEKAKRHDNFTMFADMEQEDGLYESEELFEIFASRLLKNQNIDFYELQEWLGIDEDTHPLDELSLTNGTRKGDALQFFAVPTCNGGNYKTQFFIHGLGYLSKCSKQRASSLEEGEKLYMLKDFQNETDTNALMIRANAPAELLGYVPRIYASDLNQLSDIELCVKRVNYDAPAGFRVLCALSASWPEEFVPFGGSEFERIGR